MIGQAHNILYRTFWIILYITCASGFLYNGKNVINKYNRNEKIVDIQVGQCKWC